MALYMNSECMFAHILLVNRRGSAKFDSDTPKLQTFLHIQTVI